MNTSTASQTIQVQDTTDPVLANIPANVTVECDAVPSLGLNGVTATDNCDPTVNITWADTRVDGPCTDTYQLIRTWTATDNCLNTSTASQTIQVQDTTDPILANIPANVTVECDAVPSLGLNGVTATDNCDPTVNITWADTRVDGPCTDTYQLIRTWTATDNCLNTSTASQTIQVQDTTDPILANIPANVTVECDAVPSLGLNGVTATDNCDPTVNITWSDTRVDGPCTDTYQLIRTWTATDNCLNTSTASQTIQVQDTTDPVLANIPANVTVECDAVPSLGLNGVTATDNCDPTVNITWADTRVDGPCTDTYQLIRTWTATDNCLNTSTASQTIQVQDTTDPILANIPANVTVECDAVPSLGLNGVTATDNCDPTVNITWADTRVDGPCTDTYQLIRTWTATDNCLNTSTSSQTIQVQDTTDPILANIPANVTVECDAVPSLGLNGVTATDNCDPTVNITWADTRVDGPCTDTYQLIRTWTATDNCLNTSTASQTIQVQDTTDPVLANIPANVTVECDAVPSLGLNGVTATDNCDPTVNITWADTRVDGPCTDTYQLIRTWTATDNCLNTSTASQTIQVQDTTDPILANIPANVTVECDAVPSLGLNGVTATDNCDPTVNITWADTRVDGPCTDTYQLIRTWTATDNCLNTSTASQTIQVQDTTQPVIAGVPSNITVDCDNIPTAAIAIAADNCDNAVQILYSEQTIAGPCVDSYVIIRLWSATDNCNNTATATQQVTVQDIQAPVLAGVPANITSECNAIPIAPISGIVTSTDNCDNDVDISMSETNLPGPCSNAFTLIRTWTATDNCGNTTTASQSINVSDNTAPVLVGLPSNITVECSNIPTATIVTATDNCDLQLDVLFNENTTAGICTDSYTITRIWTVTDDCGNLTTGSQTVFVHDTESPVLAGIPSDVTASCDNIPTIPPAGNITATDNCDTDVTIAFVEVQVPGACAGSYSITRTWTATDNCGNSSVKTQIISVGDAVGPVFAGVPADVTVACDNIPNAAQPVATDNCDNNPIVVFSETTNPGACANSFGIIRKWTATDNCGNATTATQNITVQDTEAPVLSGIPVDITAECNGIPTIPPAGNITATDNCDTDVTIAFVEVQVPGACAGSYSITRTWTATDNCGNTSEKTQIISVGDAVGPVFAGVPADVTVACDNIPAAAQPTATDNCDTNPTVQYSETTQPGTCTNSYTIVRKWTATDACGNATTATQNVVVEDKVAPVLSGIPTDITSNCNGVPTVPPAGTVTATDNCDTDVTISMAEVQVPGSCAGSYSITRTWTATDNCGNTSEKTQIISVGDAVGPVFAGVPADVTVACDNIPAAAQPTATDNCDTNPTVQYSETTQPGTCTNSYTIVRKWTATDACGNATTATQNVVVEDKVAPVLSGIPADITSNCNGVPTVPPAGTVTATDNCDTDVTISMAEVQVPGACAGSYSITRTWTATDNCGNTSEKTQIISVGDAVGPVFAGVPADVTVACDNIPAAAQPTATDNCDTNRDGAV